MPQTTIDIDPAVLRELEERALREGKTLGRLASELLARSLRTGENDSARGLEWTSKPMLARVDLEDEGAMRHALEGRSPSPSTRSRA
jgi:hypothetical protein